jgi:hypothetical protein
MKQFKASVFALVALVVAGSCIFASAQQAEQIKKKARDLKRNVESTNSPAKTNAPAKR